MTSKMKRNNGKKYSTFMHEIIRNIYTYQEDSMVAIQCAKVGTNETCIVCIFVPQKARQPTKRHTSNLTKKFKTYRQSW